MALRSPFLILVALLGPPLFGQSTLPRTEIIDPAWSGSATALDLSRPRATPATARLSNVSIRARTGAGENTLIAGAAVQGSGSLPVLVRAIGPGLAQFGVASFLRDPQLLVFRRDALSAQTNNFGPGVAAASTYVGAFPPAERGAFTQSGDAVLVGQVGAEVLTAHCTSAIGAPGVALIEFYDASAVPTDVSARFVNLSSRAQVEAGEGTLVVGFVITGDGHLTLLLRGIGPSLQRFGVAGFLGNPSIELFSGRNSLATNDNWTDAGAAEQAKIELARETVGAFPLTDSRDASLLVSLPAGAYTLQVRSANAQAGVALAEIHEVGRSGFDPGSAINAVGLDLFRTITSGQPEQNLAISPYSIESALALAYAGADGATREEMARVLRLPADDNSLQLGFAGLRTALEQVAATASRLAQSRTATNVPTDPLVWAAANRLFGQEGYAFREPFLALMRDGFSAPFQAMDFITNYEPSRLAINAWVEEQTRQRILNLIPEGGLDRYTRLVLVNALYLKAPWDIPFPKSATTPRNFRLANGISRAVPTMERTGRMGYAAEEGFTFVTLPYLGGELQFVIALPNEGQTITQAAARLSPASFIRVAKLAATNPREVDLFLPKFSLRGATASLKGALKSLGMKTAFDDPSGSANFDRMFRRTPDEYLTLSDVFHQTFVALDEEGTEAAAATAVVVSVVTSAPPPPITVRVDRPFLFAIQHVTSGTCLFLGRVTDPQ